jgi:glutamine cyclotransferase
MFASSCRDTLSRIYEIDPTNIVVLRAFDMPAEAVHTSGLSWDGSTLWAVDYISNKAYRIDLEPSLASGRAVVSGSFDTGLGGTSACAMVEWEGKSLLAISDFMRTGRTYLVRPEEALAAGNGLAAVEFSYENEGFSQGLEFAEGSLFETENKFRSAVVNRLDLARLKETGSARASIVKQYPAPDRGVEDLVLGDGYMWTSDEHVFRIFRGRLE